MLTEAGVVTLGVIETIILGGVAASLRGLYKTVADTAHKVTAMHVEISPLPMRVHTLEQRMGDAEKAIAVLNDRTTRPVPDKPPVVA